ncbi:hypothetical protein BDY24DRAFT_414134 [Mrakia frigida]|uniref:uncharacterized protein n=1 Tax=Mrakia frigida TaxID=29902 RepID=UPI003FCBF3BF
MSSPPTRPSSSSSVPTPLPKHTALAHPQPIRPEVPAGKLFQPKSVVMPLSAFGMVFVLGAVIWSNLSSNQWELQKTRERGFLGAHGLSIPGEDPNHVETRADRRINSGVDKHVG